MKKIFTLLVALLSVFSAYAYDSHTITYTTLNDSLVAFNATGDFGANFVSNVYEDGKGTITFDGPVTSIGNEAFSYSGTLTSITLPKTVTSIGVSAFTACIKLSEIEIPSSVVSISGDAFNACSALRSVNIPEGVKTIGSGAFANCTNLSSAVLPSSLTTLGQGVFMNCVRLESVNIPYTITSIADQTFLNCSSLKTITIHKNLTDIGWWAFDGCSGLTSITSYAMIPPNAGDYAFEGVVKSIPVYVPCGSVNAYQTAKEWKAFTNIIEPEPEIVNETHTACDSYIWRGTEYFASGLYSDTLVSVLTTCDSVIYNLDLTINHSALTELQATACGTYTWSTNGETYTASGIYRDTLQTIHGCDSVVVLNLTIHESVQTDLSDEACDTYTWSTNGETYTASGIYRDTLQTVHGCDSVVVLNLTIHESVQTDLSDEACDTYTWSTNGETYTASGIYRDTLQTIHGCDSVVVLHLTIHESKETDLYETACDSYVWSNTGKTYTTSGIYYDTLQTVHGCDSVVALHLTVNESKTAEETIVACDSYVWNGNTYTSSGDYVYNTVAANGCDSVVTLHLTINKSTQTDLNEEACDSYTWSNTGATYDKSGIYYDTLQTVHGCDSIVALHLTIHESVVTEIKQTACDTYTWSNTGETYAASGIYRDTLQTIHGCDSIVALHLTINQSLTAEETVVACDSYIWNGNTYTTSGDYVFNTVAVNGCDSVVTLHLTINQSKTAEVTEEACDSYTWNGNTYTTSGDYVFNTIAFNGCDSVVTLHLTIHQSKTTEVTAEACDTYTWSNTGVTYDKSGIYRDTLQTVHGCDSIVELHLTINKSTIGKPQEVIICYGESYTWNGVIYDATGEYTMTLTNAVGCDSTAYLHLTVLPDMTYQNENINACPSELPYKWYDQSLTSSGTYTYRKQFAGTNCDSVEHVLTFVVLPESSSETTVEICDSYTWNGSTYTKSGDYTYTTTGANGCDSVVTLHLTIHESVMTNLSTKACDSYTWSNTGVTYDKSGTYYDTLQTVHGCDSIVALHLTVNKSTIGTPSKVAICYGTKYNWNGVIYDATGEYTMTLTNAAGCDSTAYLHLTVLPDVVIAPTESHVICHGDSYSWHGQNCNENKTYTHVLKNAAGCDSLIYTLDLTVLPEVEYMPAESKLVCYGETYTWREQVCSKTATYTDVIKNALGCDSLVYTLNFVVLPQVVTLPVEEQVVCNGESYTWNNKTYDHSGTYTHVDKNVLGCDSIIHTLNLTILPKMSYDIENVSVCPSELPYKWYGENLSATGTYTYREQFAQTMCDSIEHILNLIVLQESTSTTIVESCEKYKWNGVTYTKSGTYTYTTTGANGCDSIATLQLTIHPSTVGAPEYVTICHGESYTWNGFTFAQDGYYSMTLSNVNGCDSTASMYLTILPEMSYEYEEITVCPSELPYMWRGQQLTAPGTYTDREQYTHYDCDRIEYVLTFKVYDTSLPNYITMPKAVCGYSVDVSAATADIEAYISSNHLYAPNTHITWQEKKNGIWSTLGSQVLKGSDDDVTLRYLIHSDCGTIESGEMVIPVEMPNPENSVEMNNIAIISRFGNRIFLLDVNNFAEKFGWKPSQEQVTWYKVIGTLDKYGELGNDILVGTGHTYSLPSGDVIVGSYYAQVEQEYKGGDDCASVCRSVVITGLNSSDVAPRLVPNVVRPNESLTIINLDVNQAYEINVFSTTGELIASYNAENVSEFVFQAKHALGYYMVDVVNENEKTTLRYVVK